MSSGKSETFSLGVGLELAEEDLRNALVEAPGGWNILRLTLKKWYW